MNITTVVQIIRIDKQISQGVVSFSEEVVEVFDYTRGSSTADICQKALERCQELNIQHSNSCRSYVTNRID